MKITWTKEPNIKEIYFRIIYGLCDIIDGLIYILTLGHIYISLELIFISRYMKRKYKRMIK